MYHTTHRTEFKMNEITKLVLDKKRLRVKECPCGKDNRDGKFVPWVGFDNKGYCHSCAKTFVPEFNNCSTQQYYKPSTKKVIPIEFIPNEVFERQLRNGKYLFSQNEFVKWLGKQDRGEFAFDSDTITRIVDMYRLVNSGRGKYKGWALFPYIDIKGNVRDIKAMAYNSDTGKRLKEPNKVLFIGKEILKKPTANTERCFYGEHLLNGNNKPVKIFESEATAIYASPFYPNYVCLATGGNNGCKWTEREKCEVLRGRSITLYPDIDAHEDWLKKAVLLNNYGLNVSVSNLIKASALKFAFQYNVQYADLVKQKFDMRDILKNKILSDFIKPIPKMITRTKERRSTVTTKVVVIKPPNWNNEIKELELFFANTTLPSGPIKLSPHSTIINSTEFVKAHLSVIKNYNGNTTFLPYLERLIALKEILNN